MKVSFDGINDLNLLFLFPRLARRLGLWKGRFLSFSVQEWHVGLDPVDTQPGEEEGVYILSTQKVIVWVVQTKSRPPIKIQTSGLPGFWTRLWIIQKPKVKIRTKNPDFGILLWTLPFSFCIVWTKIRISGLTFECFLGQKVGLKREALGHRLS